MSGRPTRAAGKLGQALQFDGVNDHVNAGTGDSLQITGAITLAGWAYDTDPIGSGNYGRIVTKFAVTPSTLEAGYDLARENNKMYFRIAPFNITSVEVFSTGDVDVGVWTHWVGVYTPGQSLRLYKNGQLDKVTSTIVSSQYNNTQMPVQIRRYLNTGTDDVKGYWEGKLDDVRIYNRALSPDEIKRLYNVGR